MKIAVIGRGNVGGGLADFWERAGHEVNRIGREGGDISSMSRKLWVRFLRFEGVYRKVTSQRPLLGAPQSYLRGQCHRTRLVREDAHHPRPPLHLLEQALEHVRRTDPRVVASRKAEVAQGVCYPCLEDRDCLRVALLVEHDELFYQRLGRLLSPDLEDRR